MRTPIIAVAGLSLALLTGCSGSPEAEEAPKVVSLQAPSASAAPKAPAAPVIRPDTTALEVRQMQQPWMKCLRENDVPIKTREGLLDIDARGSGKLNGRIMATSDQKVVKACGKLMPVYAPELDEDKNPYWADDNDNYHECLVEAGVPLVKKDGKWWPGPGWGEMEPNEPLELSCQAKAFDGKKG
ncbi:hypothetical protein [Actinoplanes friuliensis]|jgi:hypothetical protein|uniref:Lipoprotein n=1 Tax=Actinoplanes friuliensis DSM 7358 TaxID=1246995 RepID=U5W4B3_9ACTN|nr:hypothetical protein [Actinoplanes friuliensis]AGZ43979.1 hypothetical protein AFR_28590 [Actinoplanes friuliensis DSM 7358]